MVDDQIKLSVWQIVNKQYDLINQSYDTGWNHLMARGTQISSRECDII
jgi:hypothetical protein